MNEQERHLALERLFKGIETGTVSFDLFAPDCVWEWPQSGERIRGVDNQRAIMEHYPGTPKVDVRRVFGDGEVWVGQWTGDYDGDVVHGVTIAEFRGDLVARVTEYFASPFPAPDWRAQWVEPMAS